MKVLFATDGGRPAAHARSLLKKIGDRGSIQVDVVSVVADQIPLGDDGALGLGSLVTRTERAGNIVDEAVEDLSNAGFAAAGSILEGFPQREILHAIEKRGHDLIVIGAGSKSWLGHVLLGSVSTAILHASPTSVLIAHDPPGDEERARVLLGIDGSENAYAAGRDLEAFADPARCLVSVLSVASVPLGLGPAPGMFVPYAYSDETERRLIERAREHAERAAGDLRRAGFEADAQVATGHASTQLLKEMENLRCDLIAIGSRGLGPIRRAVLGSTSDHLARHSPAALIARVPRADH